MDAMRVERCGGCGARYNVTRLAPGSRFACRRCGGVVVVSVTPDASSPPRTPRAPFVVGGLLLLVAAVARSWPGVVAGAPDDPWGRVVLGLPLVDATSLAWLALTGGLALAAAAPAAGRGLHGVLAVAALTMFLRSHAPDGAMFLLRAPAPLAGAALAALGAGALLLGASAPTARGTARPFVLGGALAFVAALATTPGAHGASALAARAEDVVAWLVAVWRGDEGRDAGSAWPHALPDTLVALGALAAGLAVLWPGRRTGGVSRTAGRLAYAAFLVALAAPGLADAWALRDRWLAGDGASVVAAQVAATALDRGLAPWLVLSALAATAALPRGGTPRGTASTGLAHLAVAGAAAALLVAARGAGSATLDAVHALAADVARAPATAQHAALLVAGGVALLLATVRPLRRRGGPAFGVLALALAATDLGVPSVGVPRTAWAVLVAAVGGALVARRGARWDGRGRVPVLVAAGTLVALLAFPVHGPEAEGGAYTSALSALVAACTPTDATTSWWTVALDPDVALPACAAVAVAAALFASATGPRTPLVGLAVLAAVVAAVHGPVAAAVGAAGPAPTAWDALLAAAAHAVGATAVPAALAALAASGDAVGGRPG